ncbi:MAG: ribonucleoside-diphosphate reductase, adenosylcobalamin-dependent [Sporomusa sp.]|nr:ribonucleoside-diphosphate reductase, adenosylcobalamin-dependent [Sporomusa sp.]
MNLSDNAIKVLEKRYLSKDENGQLLEDVDGMFRRVAKAVAGADAPYVSAAALQAIEDEFYEMMSSLEFLPNSPTLMNAGRPLGQLSACFVLPIEDTMEDIFETLKNAAMIHKSGGGTGFSFSRLRPKGAAVNSTGGVASGPVSFMKVFNAATEAVKQGGTRRGANMGILRVDHPDIMEFITAKKDNADITNFNISVGITDVFMNAVAENEEYDLIDPHHRTVTGRLNAREVFDVIVDMAWSNGEPGIIFLDRLNQDNVTPELGDFESTNPCGEQPLLPYESCNLGSINLSLMVIAKENKPAIDFERIGIAVKKAIHFLDNVIDVNKYPLPEIEQMTKSTRKIGLGVMGWADLLCQLRVPYNSQQALLLAEQVMGFIREQARMTSMELAELKGVFPHFEQSTYHQQGLRVRNATTTTIAPTGTLSILAGVSSGIEPLFALAYIRNVMDNDELMETNPFFKQAAITGGFYTEPLMRTIAAHGTIKGLPEIPVSIQDVFVTAHDISSECHVEMQAAFQKYTDNAVSKTVNLSNKATREDVQAVFNLAYEAGCKGVTIYRDGSRDLQVLNIGKVNGKETPSAENAVAETKQGFFAPRARPDITTGFTEKVKIGCGTIFITVNYDQHGICEVFTNTGRAGGCPSQSEATARLVSIALRSGMDAHSIIDQLKGIRCHSTIRQKDLKVLSCPDAIGKVIEKVMKLQNGDKAEANTVFTDGDNECPECGKPVEHEGGCVICRHCGFSKCG